MTIRVLHVKIFRQAVLLDAFVYLADARFNPKGEINLHDHQEIGHFCHDRWSLICYRPWLADGLSMYMIQLIG